MIRVILLREREREREISACVCACVCSSSKSSSARHFNKEMSQKKIEEGATGGFDDSTRKLRRRGLKNTSLKKIKQDALPDGFIQRSGAGYDTAAATKPELEEWTLLQCDSVSCKVNVTQEEKVTMVPKKPPATCPLCGCTKRNLLQSTKHRVRVADHETEALRTCGLCGAGENSYCTRCFITWTCEIASLAAATEDIYLKPYVNASHVCCCCIAAVPRMTAQDALGTEIPKMTSMTHHEWDHINAVFKYVDEHGFPPLEIVSCRKLEVKLPAADHGYASSKASTLSREDSWTLVSTLSTEDSWTLVDE